MTPGAAHLRRAEPGDAEAITRLALRSKRHWGYDEAFMATVAPAMSCHPADVVAADQHIEVLDDGGHLLGFFRLRRLTELAFLEDLFVDPEVIGQGFGRQLFLRAAEVARAWGAGVMEFESDPFAEPFYLRLGARRVGMSPSKLLPGRSIPLMRYPLLG